MPEVVPSAVAACAAPTASLRSLSPLWKPRLSALALCRRWLCGPRRRSLLFVAAVETIVVCLGPLPPLAVQPPPPFVALCCFHGTLFVAASETIVVCFWPLSPRPVQPSPQFVAARRVSNEEYDHKPVDDEVVYYKVAGECPKRRVYGLGSLRRKKRRYADPDASTSQVLAQRGMGNFMILRDVSTPKELLEGVQAMEQVLLLFIVLEVSENQFDSC
ncbi:hypothetical protein Syun_018379 [Stephania yunnanensis]|uniref:Uncharacterized protein n=1 Tax=Stephania yunnanensis TaxID=152371 RepID=A0AAP0IS46_9MAGN